MIDPCESWTETHHRTYKVCENCCQQSTSETEQDKMDKQFDNLTWSDLTIIDD